MSASRIWRLVEWTLFVVWVTAAVVTMYPEVGRALHLYGTLFTSYAADLTNPAWLYIVMRHQKSRNELTAWLGRSPASAAVGIFAAGTVSELVQLYWPEGLFRGVFDPFDIVAFGTGLLFCYIADKRFPIRDSMRATMAPATAA